MRFFRFFIGLFVLFSTAVFSQDKVKHVVMSGESVYSIARKYNVSEAEIFELNPKAKGLLQLDMVLLIPKNSKKKAGDKKSKPVSKGATHTVESGESLYTIARKYDTSIDKLREANPQLESDNLQLGELLALPKGVKKGADERLTKADASKIAKYQGMLQKHTVASGESFYVIAKKYHVSVEDLKKANPQVKNNKLDVKDVVFIPGSEEPSLVDKKNKATSKAENEPVKPVSLPTVKNNQEFAAVTHQVMAKETKYGIAKRYGITIADLEKLNPHIINGLEIGQQLLIKGVVQNDAIADAVKENLPEADDKDANDIASASDESMVGTKAAVLPLSADAAMKADFLIDKASENLGVRYRGGGTDKNGFDCSGLMFATFRNIDMTLPRSSSDMAATAGVKIDRSQAQPGDLIFFTTRGRWVGHVGLITEVLEDEIKFIHSSTSAGVIISSTKESYYAKRFVQINRVLN